MAGLGGYCVDNHGITEQHAALDYVVNYDLDEAAAHEIGHGIGIGHSADPNAVMYPTVHAASGLGADDLNAIRALYPPIPPFTASLDAQFPADALGKVYVTAGGPAVDYGFNIRYSQPFNASNFVLRPTTPASVDQFSSKKGDFTGSIAPNDDRVGYYRASVSAPASTPPGTYFIQWNTINRATGQFGGLQPSFNLVVRAPDSEPPPPPPPPPPADSCPPPAPGGPYSLTRDPLLTASIDAQFPADGQGVVHVARGGSVGFGYNVRYNATFNPQSFALRTDTPGYINYFSSAKGDWYGSTAPNDNRVGYYRATLTVPSCVPKGDYFMRWNVINMANGRWAGLQPSFVLRVE